jgi:hypothetical protein
MSASAARIAPTDQLQTAGAIRSDARESGSSGRPGSPGRWSLLSQGSFGQVGQPNLEALLQPARSGSLIFS